jgi:hypothetical protein
MATGPLEILDGLVKGVVLATYDFVRLTGLGFLLPFFRRTRRVWSLVRRIDKHLSSLTYLVIWILVVVAYASGTEGKLASSVVGFEKRSDVQVPVVVASVLLIAMFVDVSIRGGFLLVRNHVRRKFYEPIARIAVANIFLGMFIILAIEGLRHPGSILGPLPALFWGEPFHYLVFSSPLLPPFAVALAIIIVKAFAIRDWKKRVLLGLPLILIVPTILLYALSFSFTAASEISIALFPSERSGLSQRFTHCTFLSGQLRASGVLSLVGANARAIDPRFLAILYEDRYIGRGKPMTSKAVSPQAVTAKVTAFLGNRRRSPRLPTSS